MARQSGKTTTIAARAVWFAASHPGTLTLVVAPSLRQSMIMMDRIQAFVATIPSKIRRGLVRKVQRTVITLRSGSKIVALPCSENLLRGYTAHLILCDEAAFFHNSDTIFYNILFPMLATTNGTMVISSTPWGKNTTFYRFANDKDFSKHLVTWREVVEAGLIKAEFIEEMRRTIPAQRFRMEFEAEFVEDDTSWLRQDLIASCIDPDLEIDWIDESDII